MLSLQELSKQNIPAEKADFTVNYPVSREAKPQQQILQNEHTHTHVFLPLAEAMKGFMCPWLPLYRNKKDIEEFNIIYMCVCVYR